MGVSEQEVDSYFDQIEDGSYGKNWSDYIMYKARLEEKYKDERMNDRYYTTIETWQPIIWGAMLKQPLKEFFGHWDWSKTDEDGNQGVYIMPPCGEIPTEVMLVMYHAKKLQDVECTNELPADAMEQYQNRRKELLYGQDALSVIELFEVGL